ncbi:(Fe-S)-binding protein, partial [Candidatus Sumerlaeota bacterium]|nr:(Fe-S)-binding protein [Candidatus Sumerlaeota bacterium]
MDEKKDFRIEDVGSPGKQWTHVSNQDLMPMPPPLDDPASEPEWRVLKQEAREKYEASLDDTLALNIPQPKSKEEEQALVRKFLDGMSKLFSKEDNWPFLRPFMLTIAHCANCQTCSEACHIFEASGRNPVYRPTVRAEILRRIYYKYLRPGGRFYGKWLHGDIDLSWRTVARLAELSYRCNLCR